MSELATIYSLLAWKKWGKRRFWSFILICVNQMTYVALPKVPVVHHWLKVVFKVSS